MVDWLICTQQSNTPATPPPAAGIDLNARAWLEGRLTPAERQQWEEHGYLIIRDALPSAQHEALLEAVDSVRTAAIASGQHEPHEMTHAAGFSPPSSACGYVHTPWMFTYIDHR